MYKKITETIPLKVEKIFKESVDSGSNIILKGTFITADLKNNNDRIYPKDILYSAYKEYLKTIKDLELYKYGELEHPEDDELGIIHKDRVICKIKKIQWNDETNSIDGEIILISDNKDLYNYVIDYIRTFNTIGISLRGVGNSEYKNGVEYVTELFIITFDLTVNPSDKRGYLKKLTESVKENAKKYYIKDNIVLCRNGKCELISDFVDNLFN